MDEQLRHTGWFSVLRWSLDPTREEAKNVAVILVDRDGSSGGVRAAPISTISPRLHEQGILDAVVANLDLQFKSTHKPDLGTLTELHQSMRHSLVLTEPKPTAIADADVALAALYKAYCAPRGGGGASTLTKGRALDRVVDKLRRQGAEIRRGQYVDDFLFDAVVAGPRPRALEVLSFANPIQRWSPTEHDAAHFLYAIERVDMSGAAIVYPPTDASHQNASVSHDRVMRWFAKSTVEVVPPDDVSVILTGS